LIRKQALVLASIWAAFLEPVRDGTESAADRRSAAIHIF
jgi:hypothetical protein